MKKEIIERINEVIDPEVGFSVVQLGLIYDVQIKGSKAIITMTLSTKSCPMHELMLSWVKEAALRANGINEAEINLVWEPAWDVSMCDEQVISAIS